MHYSKPLVPDLDCSSSIQQALDMTVEYLRNGIGMPKASGKWIFPIAYSNYVHNPLTLERYKGVMESFKKTSLSGVDRIGDIGPEHVKVHFSTLVKRRVRKKTILVNCSALTKFFNALNRTDLIDYIDGNRIEWASLARVSGKTIPFADPARVINAINGEVFKAAATVQYLAGTLVSDIRKVASLALSSPPGTRKFSFETKGGRIRALDLSGREAALYAIIKASRIIEEYFITANPVWQNFKMAYTKAVRNAAAKTKEIYCGTQSFVASYAAERSDELFEASLKEDEFF